MTTLLGILGITIGIIFPLLFLTVLLYILERK